MKASVPIWWLLLNNATTLIVAEQSMRTRIVLRVSVLGSVVVHMIHSTILALDILSKLDEISLEKSLSDLDGKSQHACFSADLLL